MRAKRGRWKCESCGLSNREERDRCFYCGLPEVHTAEELEKYRLVLPGTRHQNKNIWVAIFSIFLESIFTRPSRYTLPLGFVLLIGLIWITPIVKDHMWIAIPIAAVLSAFIVLYFYMKK